MISLYFYKFSFFVYIAAPKLDDGELLASAHHVVVEKKHL